MRAGAGRKKGLTHQHSPARGEKEKRIAGPAQRADGARDLSASEAETKGRRPPCHRSLCRGRSRFYRLTPARREHHGTPRLSECRRRSHGASRPSACTVKTDLSRLRRVTSGVYTQEHHHGASARCPGTTRQDHSGTPARKFPHSSLRCGVLHKRHPGTAARGQLRRYGTRTTPARHRHHDSHASRGDSSRQ